LASVRFGVIVRAWTYTRASFRDVPCRPKVTTRRGVIWPRDSLLPVGEGKMPRACRREGQGLKYPLSETGHELVG
jgi:hypothetical protein